MATSAVDDPMPGSIARAVERVQGGYLINPRELSLALNESFRNGMDRGAEEHDCSLPQHIEVNISNLLFKNNENWPAIRTQSATVERPLYVIVEDVNAVAVGRFKASLRKFLGVD